MNRFIRDFSSRLSGYSQTDQDRMLSAAAWAESLHTDQKRASGHPYIIHPLEVGIILLRFRLDSVAIVAALLHDVLEDTNVTVEEIRLKFGAEVSRLVDGVTKISLFRVKNHTVQNAETIRKMLLTMVRDIRIILIKLADKLHNMRTLENLDIEKSQRIAAECLEIYAPLAERLGIFWMKVELEDLSLKCLKPNAYSQIRKFITEKRGERAQYLVEIKAEIRNAASGDGIDVEMITRAKHFYSIYQKMKDRGVNLEEIYDLLGIRVLCGTTSECYSILGLIHRSWKPLTGRFKDYIAMPKANRYQSLHTTVIGPGGRRIEIQIRTHEMNRTAEYGIAAHWLYKSKDGKPGDLVIVQKLRKWSSLREKSDTFLEEIKNEILKDSIYVFTPEGDVVELPLGATPIDFAYRIHTEVGNRCTGAKVEGRILPLRSPLENTQVVEIITSPGGRPHLDWLRYAKTSRARSKIRQWLNKYDDNLIIDRNIVAKNPPSPRVPSAAKKSSPGMSVIDTQKVGVRIGRERNILIRLAGCCNPTTGDKIVGYVSRGKGITVHRDDCSNVRAVKDFTDRRIDVEWETVSPKAVCRLYLTARTGADIFSEIEGAIKKYQGHLIAGRLTPGDEDTVTGDFTIEIDRSNSMKRILKNLRTIPSIINIRRSSDENNSMSRDLL